MSLYVCFFTEMRSGRDKTSVKFELSRGELRYTNRSREDTIRHRCTLGPVVQEEIRRLIDDSDILAQSDRKWPEADNAGLQELEIELSRDQRKRFVTNKLISMAKTGETADPTGLKIFYNLTHDLREFFMGIITLHFKRRPL